MRIFMEDFMPKTAKALRRLEQASEHHERTYQTAAQCMCSVSREVEEGSLIKDAIYNEATVWDEKIEDAEFTVKTWKREVYKEAAIEVGGWLLIGLVGILFFAMPFIRID